MPYILLECPFYTVLYYKCYTLVQLHQNTTVEKQALTNSHKEILHIIRKTVCSDKIINISVFDNTGLEKEQEYCSIVRKENATITARSHISMTNAFSTVRLSNLLIAIRF